MTTKHTPGPWFSRDNVIHNGGSKWVAMTPSPYNADAEEKANRKLIAEAPAMLEAVRDLVNDEPIYSDPEEGSFCQHCSAKWNSYATPQCVHEPNCVYERAAAILARIDGRKG